MSQTRREADLYPPVRDWLRSHGHAVHVEVFDCDIVAVRGSELTAVELKLDDPQKLLSQCHRAASWADWVIAVMPHKPKNYAQFRAAGFGFIVVRDGVARQGLRGRRQPDHWQKRHAYRIGKLTGRPEAMDHELAGLPACPALKQQRQKRQPAPDLCPSCGTDGPCECP